MSAVHKLNYFGDICCVLQVDKGKTSGESRSVKGKLTDEI